MSEPDITSDELAALEQSGEAIVVVEVSGSIRLMNEAAQKTFGVLAEDVVGESHELLVPEGLQWGHQAYRRGYFAEPSPRWMDPGLDPHGQRPDGSLVPVSVWLEPRRLEGSLVVVAHVSERTDGAVGHTGSAAEMTGRKEPIDARELSEGVPSRDFGHVGPRKGRT